MEPRWTFLLFSHWKFSENISHIQWKDFRDVFETLHIPISKSGFENNSDLLLVKYLAAKVEWYSFSIFSQFSVFKYLADPLIGALSKCRQFKKWLRKILDNYQNVDILETCLDSPKFCWLWKCRHLVVGKFQNLDILKILVKCNSLDLFILIVSINPKSSLRCDAFMCHKLSSPRRVGRFAWNFGGIYNSTRAIARGTFALLVGTS